MIYHYYDPWNGIQVYGREVTTTNTPSIPLWKSQSGFKSVKSPGIDVVKSDKFTTLVVRDEDGAVLVVVDLTAEEATELAERLTNDNDS